MTLVIDASVAVKWYFEQPGSGIARDIAGRDEELIAPDLIFAEAGSAVWQYVRAGFLGAGDAAEIMQKMLLRIDRFAPLSELVTPALDLAIALNHPIYDCIYLALAQREGAALVTADRRLAAAVGKRTDLDVQLLVAP
jgi:predicted nucleic acid-binding protein